MVPGNIRRTLWSGLGALAFAGAAAAWVHTQPAPVNPLIGVWRLQETTGPNQARQPTMRGLHIFTKQHYSTVRLAESAPVVAGKISDAQKAELFDALTVDTGAYEVKGNILTRHSIASKTPANSAAAAPITEFKVEGNQLFLYPRPNGQPASPTNYLKYVRVE